MPKITGSLRRWSEGRYGRCERNIQEGLAERQALFKFLFFCFADEKSLNKYTVFKKLNWSS